MEPRCELCLSAVLGWPQCLDAAPHVSKSSAESGCSVWPGCTMLSGRHLACCAVLRCAARARADPLCVRCVPLLCAERGSACFSFENPEDQDPPSKSKYVHARRVSHKSWCLWRLATFFGAEL